MTLAPISPHGTTPWSNWIPKVPPLLVPFYAHRAPVEMTPGGSGQDMKIISPRVYMLKLYSRRAKIKKLHYAGHVFLGCIYMGPEINFAHSKWKQFRATARAGDDLATRPWAIPLAVAVVTESTTDGWAVPS
jgi:hypothetical protein